MLPRFKNFLRYRSFHKETEDSYENAPGEANEDDVTNGGCDNLTRIDPVVRTYIYPDDITSGRRYLMLVLGIVGSFLWWLGPSIGILVADPMIQLILDDASTVTPQTECFDHRLTHQTCKTQINVEYYFYNLTNKNEWLAGIEPPSYEERGPYAFRTNEHRYNMVYNKDWSTVSFTYHQSASFDPEKSCEECSLEDNITSINRGYLQFLAGGNSGTIDAETGTIFQMMPTVLYIIRASIVSTIAALNPSSSTIDQDAIRQWADCSFLSDMGLPEPFLTSLPLPPGTSPYPFDLEFCSYIHEASEQQFGMLIDPSNFSSFGLGLNTTAGMVFLNMAIGQTNLTHIDPGATYFLEKFLTTTQNDLVSELLLVDPLSASILNTVPPLQWALLQGYLVSLVPTWGTLTMSQWLEQNAGGLVLTQPLHNWLYGYEDPLLATVAETAAALSGNPNSHRLTPWAFTPAVGLTFSSEDYPIQYFQNVTGYAYNHSMLSWNNSEIGRFHPLIQQKTLSTGKAEGSLPQTALQYRGRRFFNHTWGILNVTGVNEGVGFGSGIDKDKEQVIWDSVLSQAIGISYTGVNENINKAKTLVYNITDASVSPCNWTHYSIWASNNSFDQDAYGNAFSSISMDQYWSLYGNETALAMFLSQSPLGGTLNQYFGNVDLHRDRCVKPDLFKGIWDMSSLLACPTVYTFPRFFESSEYVVNTTGINETAWNANFENHGYALAVDPLTGYAIKGHRTYQVNHLVFPTENLYKNLWTYPGSASMTPMNADFVTVPIFWVKMWWEPSKGAAYLVVLLSTMNDVLYYMLLVGFPMVGICLLAASVYYLRLGKSAKQRARKLPSIQESRAPAIPLRYSMEPRGSTSDSLAFDANTSNSREQCKINIPDFQQEPVIDPQKIAEGSSSIVLTMNSAERDDAMGKSSTLDSRDENEYIRQKLGNAKVFPR